MCQISSLFLLQRLKGSMLGDACDFNNMETRAVTKFLFLQGKVPKEIHAILKRKKEKYRRTYTIVCHRQKLGGPV